MRNISKKIFHFVLLFLIGISYSCSSGSNSPTDPDTPDLEISSVNPIQGTFGTEITISGNGFLAQPTENTVTVNGTPSTVISSTVTTLVAKVPEGASSGTIAVTVKGETVEGPNFEVLPNQIAFRSNFSGDLDIWRINLDGSDLLNLTNDMGRDCCHDWSFDGSMIAFGSTRSGTGEIWVMNANGSNPIQLTTEILNGGGNINPIWSPDGTKLLFVHAIGGDNIWVMDTDGSNASNLSNKSGIDDDFPRWSPSGSQIAFRSTRSGNYDIWLMNADGTNPTNLTDHPSLDQIPFWSPDGLKIAFERFENSDTDIWVMDADGSNQINLTNNPAANDFEPQWSPDGTKIAFLNNQTGDHEIYVMDADGSNVVNISNNSTGDDRTPRWSKDGSKIVFISDRTGDNEVWVMDSDGSNQTQVTSIPNGSEVTPLWRPR